MDILSLTRLLYDLQITTLYHQTAIEKLHEVMRSTNSQVDKKRAERLVIEHRGHLVRLEDSFITQTARDRYEKILKLGHSIDTWLYN